MGTMVGIVYGKQSNIVRRVIIPDNDVDLTDGTHPMAAGEIQATMTLAAFRQAGSIEAAFTAATGLTPGNPACAVVDSGGTVVNMICADPAIDSVTGATLMLAPTAAIGWTLQGGVLTAPVSAVTP